MNSEELKRTFDQMAPGYDKQWAKLVPIQEALHFLLRSVFADLPADARMLCVGVGTGAELDQLARSFPRWSFTAVDLSAAMLAVCRRRAHDGGYLSRCDFYEGSVASLPTENAYDGATCFLVSQFILDREARTEFFRAIADKLRPGGILASSDLASEIGSAQYEALLGAWLAMMAAAGVPPEGLQNMRAAYRRDVAVLSATAVEAIIAAGGFEAPVQFYQAGLIRAWFSKRAETA